MKKAALILIALLSVTISTAQIKSKKKNTKEFIEVAFLSDGTRLVGGKMISDKDLKKKLEYLKKKKGEVHYYSDRRMKKDDLMKNLALMELFKKYKLPVILYKDKEFKTK